MEKLREVINKIIFIIGTILLTTITLTVAWQVVSRYVFNEPSIFTDELARFLLIYFIKKRNSKKDKSSITNTRDNIHRFSYGRRRNIINS